MPPKSATKRDQVLWFLCEKCKANVTTKEKDEHDSLCPLDTDDCLIKCTFIRNGKLYANQLNGKPITDDIRDLNLKQLNSLIFLSESVMNICGFILGEQVLVHSSPTKENGARIVRSVWPLPNSLLTSVMVSEEEFTNMWQGNADMSLIVEKLQSNPLEAGNVILERTQASSLVDKTSWKDLKQVLLVQMKGNVYCATNTVYLQFLNKTFSFTIKEIGRRNYSDVLDDLEEKLDRLKLTESFYTIARNTNLELKLEEDNENLANETMQTMSKMKLIGGLDGTIKELQDAINIAFGHSKTMSGFQIARSALIYGHAGCGKSLLCDALAESNDAAIIKINASEIFSKYFGETEANLLSQFEKAYKNYPNPTIIIIEEIINICPKEAKEDSAKRIHSAFLNVLDSIHSRRDGSRLFVITTTNNIENISSAVRRYGRLDIEIEIPVPDPGARQEILQKHLNRMTHNLQHDDIRSIAEDCHGFIGADLSSLVAKAAMNAIKATGNNHIVGVTPIEPIIQLSDIKYAYAHVTPSAMKEVLVKCPNVKWSDIGGQDDLKLKLKQSIEWPLKYPERFLHMGINPPRGILMFGPPGCSKTMIAKALATESNVNFLSVKGPELFSMWVGESERAVRDLFRKARQVAPAIIFFDEIDALGSERSNSAGGGSSVKERVLAQMLTEMDGVNALNNVTIVAATNRPDLIDKALMRPGRLDRIVYVKLPDVKTRREIVRIKLSKMPLANDVVLDRIVERTEGYSGAEIQAVCHEAGLYALEECFAATSAMDGVGTADVTIEALTAQWKHFEKGLASVRPRTSVELLKIYDEYMETHLSQ